MNSSQRDKLIREIQNLKDPKTGHDVSEFFRELPSKDYYPDYYQLIKRPLSLREIKSTKYHSMDQMKKDLMQMCENAHSYNKKGSRVFKDASEILNFIQSTEQQQQTNGGRKSSLVIKIKNPSNTAANANSSSSSSYGSINTNESGGQLMKAYKAMLQLKDQGYLVSTLFQELPSKQDYAIYYQIVKSPISLKEIKSKIDKNQYEKQAKRKGLSEEKAMEEDVILMVKNAFTFNQPTSDVCKDALALLKEFRSVLGLEIPENEDFTAIVDLSGSGTVGIIKSDGDGGEGQISGSMEVDQSDSAAANINKNKSTAKAHGKIEIKLPKKKASLPPPPVKDDSEEEDEEDEGSEEEEELRDYLEPDVVPKSDIVEEMETISFKRSTFEIGEFVYLANKDEIHSAIGVVCKIWKSKSGRNRFLANWLLHPLQVAMAYESRYGKEGAKKMSHLTFDPKELYLSDKMVEMGPMDISGRISLMHIDDYQKGRYFGWNNPQKQKDVYFFENRITGTGKDLKITRASAWRDALPAAAGYMEAPVFVPFDMVKPVKRVPIQSIREQQDDIFLQPNRHWNIRVPASRKRSAAAASKDDSDFSSDEEGESADGPDSGDEYAERGRVASGRGGGVKQSSMPAPKGMPQLPFMPQIPGMPPFAQMNPQQQQQMLFMMQNMMRMQQQRGAVRPGMMPFVGGMMPMQPQQTQQQSDPDQLPISFTTKFANKQNKVLWFNAPPRVQPRKRPFHSEAYMAKFGDSKVSEANKLDSGIGRRQKSSAHAQSVIKWQPRKTVRLEDLAQSPAVIDALEQLRHSLAAV